MTIHRSLLWALAAAVLLCPAILLDCRAAEKIVLARATIVTEADSPAYIQYAVEELAGYLKDMTGERVAVLTSVDAAKGVRILVGTKIAEQIFPQFAANQGLGDEGYVLHSVSNGGVDYLLVAGATPRGTKAALSALMKKIQSRGKVGVRAASLDVLSQAGVGQAAECTSTAGRSIRPYSFRSWTRGGVASLSGHPLLPGRQPVLSLAVHRDHARAALAGRSRPTWRNAAGWSITRRRSTAWKCGSCNARTAWPRIAAAWPTRGCGPYWRPSQEDLNPGDPEDFQAIMDSREAMYRILNNVDGVCNIDSDPGYYPGSPLERLRQGARRAAGHCSIKHNIHGKQTQAGQLDVVRLGTASTIRPSASTNIS